jgi:hypothetical protein
MDVLQSYGSSIACPTCMQVDPECFDLHIDPHLPRKHVRISCNLSRSTDCGRFLRPSARASLQLLNISPATRLGLLSYNKSRAKCIPQSSTKDSLVASRTMKILLAPGCCLCNVCVHERKTDSSRSGVYLLSRALQADLY